MRLARSVSVLMLVAGVAAGGCSPCVDSGTVCTVAGTGEFGLDDETRASRTPLYKPIDVTAEPGSGGAFFVADWNNHKIRRVDADGRIATVIGTEFLGDGDPDFSERVPPGVPGTEVALNHPTSSEWNPVTGRLLVAAWHNHRIREWDPATGNSLVVCADTDINDGNGANAGFEGDGGPCADVLMSFPNSIVVRDDGDFFFWAHKNRRLRRVSADYSLVETVAGTGEQGYAGDGGPPLEATFSDWDPDDLQPDPTGGLELGGDGLLYLSDTGNHVVRVIDLEADMISTLAGTGTQSKTSWKLDDGDPCDPDALCQPRDIEWGPDGRLYIADTYNHVVRAYDFAAETLEVVAGVLGEAGDGEEGAEATGCLLNKPYGIDFDDDGGLLIADTFNSRVRRVTP